jgi:hypothetical protein
MTQMKNCIVYLYIFCRVPAVALVNPAPMDSKESADKPVAAAPQDLTDHQDQREKTEQQESQALMETRDHQETRAGQEQLVFQVHEEVQEPQVCTRNRPFVW